MSYHINDERAAQWHKEAMYHVALTVESEIMLAFLSDRSDMLAELAKAKEMIAILESAGGATARRRRRMRRAANFDCEKAANALGVKFMAARARADDAEQRIRALYQVIGALAYHVGLTDDPNVIRALDIAAYGKAKDGTDLLPWPHTPLPIQNVGEMQALLADAATVLRKYLNKLAVCARAHGNSDETIGVMNEDGETLLARIRAVTEEKETK